VRGVERIILLDNERLQPTIASVTTLVYARFAPAMLAGEASVRSQRIERVIMRIFCVVVFSLVVMVGPVSGFEPIPVADEESAVAPLYVHFMQLGAPADSVALRVSLCTSGGFRCGPNSFIVVEELRWPPPEPNLTVTESESGGINILLEDVENEWLLRSNRIPGEYLNSERRKLPQPQVPGVRPGELGGLFLKPFEFVAWLSPLEFVVEEKRGRFRIKWHGPGIFELVEVTRLR